MKMNFNDVLYAFSYALDCVEYELLGATTNHGKRVAYISTILGKSLGLQKEKLLDLAACAVLHDNALTEYLKIEFNKERFERAEGREIGIHCTIGERNIKNLPFHSDVTGAVLYHHENADGTGAFGKTLEETPLMAQLIHFADILDVKCDLGSYKTGKEKEIENFLKASKDTLFPANHIEIFLKNFKPENLERMQGEVINILLREELPLRMEEYPKESLFHIAAMFATIIDYKSEMTSIHSIGLAQKVLRMARYYEFDEDTAHEMYLAGALHDIGKLVVSNDILEKTDKLSSEEYKYIQTHVWHSYVILNRIEGFENITRWASRHHEKLNGTGYPFEANAEELDKKDRLMACLDIYQALIEKRSYKVGMPHRAAMEILYKMGKEGLLDEEIILDIDKVFAQDKEVLRSEVVC